MSFEWITDPVSEGAECGPDLQIAADPAFMDYYFEAERRLPERYLLPTVFDPTTIRIREEESRVLPLLKRSRDIRLLSLLARFQILAGKARGFADSVEAIARLLQARPESAIPTTQNGNRARYDALDTLANTTWVIMPLRYLPLTGNPEVTLRRHHVASGKAAPRAGEEDLSAAQILDQLRSPATRAVTAALYGDVTRAAAALIAIADICSSQNRAIDYSATLDVLEDIQALILLAFPDLQAKASPAAGSATAAQSPAAPVQRPPGAPDVPAAADLTSPAEVRTTLAAAEAYLARNEPSSAALLLVTQARQLVGRPLVEALEALLPAAAAKAAIDFGPSVGFRLSMDRMKALTGATFPPDGAAAGLAQRPDPLPPRLASRSEVASHIRAVELWYRRNEPASPIPLLLARARSWLDKDFEAILAEVLPGAGAM